MAGEKMAVGTRQVTDSQVGSWGGTAAAKKMVQMEMEWLNGEGIRES
jgi:hypothetical protein